MKKGKTKDVKDDGKIDLSVMSLEDALSLLGSLGYSREQVAAVLSWHYSREKIEEIIVRTSIPGTNEYNSYHAGVSMNDFLLLAKLQHSAGDSKDSYDIYTAEMRRQAINSALSEKFGIGR